MQATVGINMHNVRCLFIHFLSLASALFVISAVRQAGKVSHSCRPRANAAYAKVRQAAGTASTFLQRVPECRLQTWARFPEPGGLNGVVGRRH